MHASITFERVEAAVKEEMFGLGNPGFCIECGEDAEGCEPDAMNYMCDFCGQYAVYGAAEVMMNLL